jgi:adenylosuccinate synthase
MPSVVVTGAQWVDDGKGDIIDILTSQAPRVVHGQGANNAGHTFVHDSEEDKLHLIPSGILHPHTQYFIGAGTVLDPEVLIQEIESLIACDIDLSNRLWISPAAPIIFPYHRILDTLLEQKKGNRSIGTTGGGIGPCSADEAKGLGICLGELIRPDIFAKALKSVLSIKNEELVKIYGEEKLSFQEIYNQYSNYASILEPYVSSVEERLKDRIESDQNVLFEGAQGTFSDITLGTYPLVTSSNTLAGGICSSAGVGPKRLHQTMGVTKAYTTRVGNGPLPSEINDNEAFIVHEGSKVTTGRKRRVGWFDAVLAKTAGRLNGLNSIALTKLDLLDHLKQIKICVGYSIEGNTYHHLPSLAEDLEKTLPIDQTVPGWRRSTSHLPRYQELPSSSKNYLQLIKQFCGIPVSMISLGPECERTIILEDLFAKKECYR